MSDPKRLAAGDGLGASLLASARGDAPRSAARARTAAALGLAVGVGAGAVGASIAPKAIGAGTSAGKAATALWLKLLAAGAVTAAVAGGVVVVQPQLAGDHADATLRERTRPTATSSPVVTAPVVTPPPAEVVTPPPAATSEAPAPVAAPVALMAPATAMPAAPAPTPTATTLTAPTESPLARELRSLDDARSALGRGDATGALAHLDRHDRAFPSGPLRTEASILRIDALLARGGSADRAAAQGLARDLLAREPAGPHAQRMRTIADGAP
ncbi:MAG: hypothetical protein JWP87_266 [Labilithrix sp.]|nr:hypothetical protein [Labilithrix sp.]